MDEKELLRSVLESAPDFIARVDLDGRFLFVNRVVPGATVEGTVGRSIFDFVPRQAHELLRSTFEQVGARASPPTTTAPPSTPTTR